jgi:hypothetical protein
MVAPATEFPKHPHPQPEQPRQSEPRSPMVYVYERQTWEYKTIAKPHDAQLSEEELDALGSKGWELAGIAPAAGTVIFYFKRVRT